MKLKKVPFLMLLFFLSFLKVFGTHIAGGNLQLIHISGDQYQLTLIAFYGLEKGATNSERSPHIVAMYDAQTQARDTMFSLALVSEDTIKSDSVIYSPCDDNLFPIVKMTYMDTITLKESRHKSPMGYFLISVNGSRHLEIKNISSPTGTGITYYLKIPRIQNTPNLSNSTPIFNDPFSKQLYIRKDKLEQIDFSATDLDNDSLIYSIDSPFDYNGSGSVSQISNVTFISGYSVSNIVNGNPTLSVDFKTGIGSIKPTETGIFVFTIVCREFRNGVEIGLVRKDLEIFVYDSAPTYTPPILTYKYLGKIITADSITIDSQKSNCFQVGIFNTVIGDRYRLNSTIQGINITSNNSSFVSNGDTNWVDVCLSNCNSSTTQSKRVYFGVSNQSHICAGASLTNSSISVKATQLKNEIYSFAYYPSQIPAPDPVYLSNTTDCIDIQSIIPGYSTASSVTYEAKSVNLIYSYDFKLSSNFSTVSQGTASTKICFLRCLPFSSTPYSINVFSSSYVCGTFVRDTIEVRIATLLNNKVSLTTDFNYLPVKEGDTLSFNVWAKSATVSGIPSLSYEYSSFNDGSVNGISVSETLIAANQIQDNVYWKTVCGSAKGSPVTFKFKASLGTCNSYSEDTLTIPLYVTEKLHDVRSEDLPNIFTPNGDGQNDYFAMPGLPEDNCFYAFRGIEIFDRWGTIVYKNTKNDFRWNATNIPDGIYYYKLDFGKNISKGFVEIIR